VTANFFTTGEFTIVTILITASYLLIRYKHVKYATPVLCFLLLGMNISNATINPITKGLSPLLENPLVKASGEIYRKDPTARWVVFGNAQWANLLKTNGINVFNGVKLIPPLRDMAVLDTARTNDTLYNRYAHINMRMYINWKDTIGFLRPYPDGYTIFMDPCSPRLKQLGIKYFVFSYQPQAPEIRCMTPLDANGYFIYKRKEE
jgi:hypothetical protein